MDIRITLVLANFMMADLIARILFFKLCDVDESHKKKLLPMDDHNSPYTPQLEK